MVRREHRGYVRVEKYVVRWTSYDPVKGVAEMMDGLYDVLYKVMVRD